jgi:long-chain acyl-CoA synthetase
LKSGDIGKIVPPNNRMVIIDRKKNIFKLAQGEYIAPEKLEGVYKTCTPLISDIFVYGDSFKSCLVNVVTVEKANQRALANELNVCNDVEDDQLLQSEDFEKAILEMFKVKGKENKFNSLEIPKGVVFNETPFADLGLLTTSFKPKRNEIKNHFLPQLNKKYESLF